MQGGALVVRHGGKSKRFDLADDAEFHICYAAFYAGGVMQYCPIAAQVRPAGLGWLWAPSIDFSMNLVCTAANLGGREPFLQP